MHTMTIQSTDHGKRLDVFLAREFSDHSRGDIVRSIKDGLVHVDKKIMKPHYTLRENDVITITNITKKNTQTLESAPMMTLAVIAETEHFLIINKPAGLQVHPSERGEQDTLVNALIAQFPSVATIGDDPMRPGIVHRLDRDTSGVMIIAKSQRSFAACKKLFHDQEVTKKYIALTHGVPKEHRGTVALPIARAATYTKQKVVYGVPTADARDALTEYVVTGHFEKKIAESVRTFALIELSPRTGRMHQVRVHMAALDCPLLGDPRYYTRKKKDLFVQEDAALNVTHHLLHAAQLSFTFDETKYTFDAPLPHAFIQTIKILSHEENCTA